MGYTQVNEDDHIYASGEKCSDITEWVTSGLTRMITYASRESSEETSQMCSLARASTVVSLPTSQSRDIDEDTAPLYMLLQGHVDCFQ